MNNKTTTLMGFGLIMVALAVSSWLLNKESFDKKDRFDSTYSNYTPTSNPDNRNTAAAPETFLVPQSSSSAVPLILPVPKTLNFAGEEVPIQNPDIRERYEKELYLTAHRYYQVVFYLKRGPRILDYISNELRKSGMHEDFKYLAVIESDLIPTIRSPKGALGIWQFMPATGRRYGLRIDKYVDERMNLEKSTAAAIRYLKEAHDRVGNWTLAAASYNMGVSRTTKTKSEQSVDNYYKMHLNNETSRYIFRILAAKSIMDNPSSFGYSMPNEEVYSLPKTKTIVVTTGVNDLAKWSTERGFTYYDLKRLNPWIINRTLPKGKFEIEVPA